MKTSLYVFPNPHIIFPWMKALYHQSFVRPCFDMSDDLIDNFFVLVILFLQIRLQLVRIKSLFHQDIGDGIDFGVSIVCDFFSSIFDVELIPKFHIVNAWKRRLQNSKLDLFQYVAQIMLSGNELWLPFPHDCSLNIHFIYHLLHY